MVETHRKRPLEDLFREQFQTDLPESLNEDQRLLIVATELDAQSERIVQFLSSQFGVNLNVVFFDYYRHGDQEFVGRSWLIAPEEVERKAISAGSSRKRVLLTLEDLASLAVDRGVGDLYRILHQGLSRLSDHVATTQSNVSYRWRTPAGSRVALVSVYPKVSGPATGLMADIRVDDLARQFDLGPAALRGALPEKLRRGQIPGLYLYAEGYPFRSMEEVDRFLRSLECGGEEAGVSPPRDEGSLDAE